MRVRTGTVFQLAGVALALVAVAGIVVPYVDTGSYGERLRGSLERALGRRVEFRGPVRFSLFSGPGFSVDDVVIHEDPSIGLEPIAYMDTMTVRPSLWSLAGGRFVIASLKLDGASINLAKSGPASEWGRWNFASLVDRSVMSRAPSLHVRNSRIHFKFGDEKSVFYLTETDLDISPPGAVGGGWALDCSAQPARTDRTAQGLGEFRLRGRWYVAPERVDLNLEIDRTLLGEMTALLRGQAGGVHGRISARLHLAGPIDRIGIAGRLNIEDVHRWDLMPPYGQGWPLDVRGRLNLPGQDLEIESGSVNGAALPLEVRFHASNYLSQPRWAASLHWNRFPLGPLLELARHMGLEAPLKLELDGAVDGAIGYSGAGSLQGELALHEAAVTIPDAPPLMIEQASIILDGGHARLAPTVVRTAGQDKAQIEADYAFGDGAFDIAISAERMRVAALRAQVALAAVPWLEQVQSGDWSGQLRYHRDAGKAGWTGSLEVGQAEIPVDGLADPLRIDSARVEIEGARVTIDRLRGAAGKLSFTGDYTYVPGAPHPHRVHLRAADWDAAQAETECLPALRRGSSLLERALGRTTLPDWLKARQVEGTLQIDRLELAGARLDGVRAHLEWDAGRVEFANLGAKLAHAAIKGHLAVNLSGPLPTYRFNGQVKNLPWQSGGLDAEGAVATSGIGAQLVANLASTGTFSGTALDFGAAAPCRAAGNYSLVWAHGVPQLKLTGLTLRTDEDVYTGHGATQSDGKLLIVLTSGAKELRVAGIPGKLKVEETAR
ncbi:MAG: hypothetical protein WBL61_19160 [Bryobacteraceae bacterium]